MKTSMNPLRRSAAVVVGALLIVGGAGIASARIMGGAPWTSEPMDAATLMAEDATFDPDALLTDVTGYFDGLGLDGGCSAAVVGEDGLKKTDVTDAEQVDVLLAYDALASALDSGQTSHMVQSTRVLLEKCDQSNHGLTTALAMHSRNWLRHYQHEVWLQEKFAEKWPEGKPGGNPHVSDDVETTETTDTQERVHGNPHSEGGSPGNGNGNGFGHNK